MDVNEWKRLIGKNVVIVLKPWELLHDKASRERIMTQLSKGEAVPDLYYRKKDRVVAKLESLDADYVGLFVYEDRVSYLGSSKDTVSVESHEGPLPQPVQPYQTKIDTVSQISASVTLAALFLDRLRSIASVLAVGIILFILIVFICHI